MPGVKIVHSRAEEDAGQVEAIADDPRAQRSTAKPGRGVDAGALAIEAPLLEGDTPAPEVDRLLREHPTWRGIVTRDHARHRLLTRTRADDLLAGRYGFGRALYHYRTLDDLMPGETLVVAEDTPVTDLARLMLDREPETRHHDAVVVYANGRVGVVEASAVFEHVCQERERALLELEGRNDELRIVAARLRDTLESMRDGFFTLDRGGRFTYLNPQCEPIFRRPVQELLGRSLLEEFVSLAGSQFDLELQRAMNQRETVAFEAKHEHSGRWFAVRAYPTREGIAVHSLDVTARHNLEAQLLQSQKLEAVGQLAGGVAHDFNNLLTVIDGYTGLAETKLDDARFVGRALEEIKKASSRAGALTAKLLAFSRKQRLQTSVIDVNDLVETSLSLIEPLIGEQFTIIRALDPQAGFVAVDVHQMEQVLLNLAVNARDAMPDGGSLHLATRPVSNGRAEHSALAPGPYVALSLRDEGIGMDAATLEHAFEPFFTTKPVGSGTGLGLSTSLGTVTQSGGHMDVASALGEGTTVTVYLPRVEAAPRQSGEMAHAQPATGGGERILIVEDELAVRSLMVGMLETLGYDVVEARDAETALAQLAAAPFDLLVTDIVMPGDDGVTLARLAVARQPRLRTLFVSGYTPDSVPDLTVGTAETAFLPKPFDVQLLGRSVREVLDR